MRVEKLLEMNGDSVVTCTPAALVADAVGLMRRHGIGAVVIAAWDGELAGLLSERDVVQGLAAWGADLMTLGVNRLANEAPPTCGLQNDVAQAMARMTDERTRHLPVVENGALQGIISIGDLVNHRRMSSRPRAATLDPISRALR